jgi:hypothetical protein
MSKAKVAICIGALVALALFIPYPTTISSATKAQLLFLDGRPVQGLKVTQVWECYGLFGGGRRQAITDATGTVRFPSRVGYGNLVTRSLGRALTLIAVHSSYGANVSIEFFVEDPSFRAVFPPPMYRPLEPFTTSGTYLDSTGRYYFPQEGKAWQSVSVRGDFTHNAQDIKILFAPVRAN